METDLKPPRCLVVAPTWVGDTIMALPVLEALASSGRTVTVLAKAHLHPLLALSPAVDGLEERAASNAATIERLRLGDFEEAVLLPNSFRAAWLTWRAGIPSRWGYRSDGRSLLLHPAVQRPPVRKLHQLRDYDALLERMGTPPLESAPRLAITDVIRQRAASELNFSDPDVSDRRHLVGLFPGAEFGPSKQWPAARFAAVARQLENASCVLIAGPKERSLAASVRQKSGLDLPIVGPDLDLAELAGVLERLDVLITNDSGPMHLAAAVGTRCVAIFGPTDLRRTAPCGDGHHVLSANRWCSPCFRKRCPLIRHRCMADITPTHVIEATGRALASPTG